MKKIKLRTKIFRISFIILFAVFLTVFVSNKYGYYEYQKHEQVTLTSEQIKKFEQDVKEGKIIDIESYVGEVNKNNQTKLSQTGLNISNSLANIVKTTVDGFFKYIDTVITQN
jgi:predicted negative regulator of RcsB-dependent stress response